MRFPLACICVPIVVLVTFTLVRADDPPPVVIPAAEAAEHVGKTRTVELTVAASKNSTNRRMIFLDSMSDYRDPRCFTVIISHDHLEAFKKADIGDPAAFYHGKTIRVSGTIIEEDDQIRIDVGDPGRITIAPGP